MQIRNQKSTMAVLAAMAGALLGGCAIHYDVQPVRIPDQQVRNFVVGTSIDDLRLIRSRWIAEGGVMVGVASDQADRDATIGVIVGAVVLAPAMGVPGAIALQNDLAGIEMAKFPRSSAYGKVAAINVPAVFAKLADSEIGGPHPISAKPPADGLYVVPSATLRLARSQTVYVACGLNVRRYSAGKETWRYQYWNYSGLERGFDELVKMESASFEGATRECLRSVVVLLQDHVAGRFDNVFESGTLMYTQDVGWRGMYYKDDSRNAYLRYAPTFLEIVPRRVMYSYKSADKK